MSLDIDELKKKIIYRSSYRGTKEMDILLSSFVKDVINHLDNDELENLFNLLNIDDDNLYKFKTLMDILSYSDGKMTILEIANAINESFNDIYPIVDKLVQEGLLTTIYEQ